MLILPVNTYGAGRAGFVLAAVTHLMALHPGFVAARTAPRLWGRILVGWALALLVVETTCAKERVLPGSLEGAEQLFPALLLMAVGLGITSTAIQGARRTLVPVLVCAAYALLGHGHAGPFGWAAEAVSGLRNDLALAAGGNGWRGRFVVIDPPHEVAGVRALRGNLPLLLAPALQPGAPYEDREQAPWLGGASWASFASFAQHPELHAWREQGLCLLLPEGPAGAPRMAKVLPPPGPVFAGASEPDPGAEGRGTWRLSLDPFELGFLNVRALDDARTGEPPIVRWDASEERPEGEVFGAWVRDEEGLSARFSLAGNQAWLLSGRVLGLRFPGALADRQGVVAARTVPILPPSVVPRRVGDDWLFDLTDVSLPDPVRGELIWVLSLLDPDRLELAEFILADPGDGKLRALGIEVEAQRLRQVSGRLFWILEPQIGGVALARALGRR